MPKGKITQEQAWEKYGRSLQGLTAGTGLFPEFIISQMYLETGGFGSELNQKYNNFGGHKAHSDVKDGVEGTDYVTMKTNEEFATQADLDKFLKGHGKGYTVHKKETLADGTIRINIDQPFKIYATPEEGLLKQVEFYTKSPKRYKNILKAQSAEEQLQMVFDAGYATDTVYVDSVKNIMNTMKPVIAANPMPSLPAEQTLIEAKSLMDKYDSLYTKKDGERVAYSLGTNFNEFYDGMPGLSESDAKSLEENILAGSRAFAEEHKETGWKAFKQDDDDNRELYLNFMKDNGYLSYTNANGDIVNFANQDLTSVEGANNSRAILNHFTNTVSNKEYGEFVTGEAAVAGYDNNIVNMFEDTNFNLHKVQQTYNLENDIYKNISTEFKGNELTNEFVVQEGEKGHYGLGPGNITHSFQTNQRGGKDAEAFVNKKIEKFVVDNNIDLRTNASQTGKDALDLVLNQAQINKVSGVDDPSFRPLEGLDDAALQAEIDSLGEEYKTANADRKAEITSMLSDVAKEQQLRKEQADAQKIEDDAYMQQVEEDQMDMDPDYIRGVQDGSIQVYDQDQYNRIMLMNPDAVQANIEGVTEEDIVKQQEDVDAGVGVEGEDDPSLLSKVWGGAKKIGTGLLGKAADLATSETGIGLLQYAAGKKSLNKAMEDIPIEEGHQLDGAWQGYMNRMRELSSRGLSAEERFAAQNDLSEAYQLGIKNVARASGGSRATFLAGAGVLNANRVKGLLKLNAMDQATHRQNLKQYGAAVQFQNTHDQREGEIDRKMAYKEAQRKSDIHGTIGATLIGNAFKTLGYATEKNANSGYMDAFMKNLDLDYWLKNQKREQVDDTAQNVDIPGEDE